MHVALHDISVDIKQNYKTTRSYDEDLKQMDLWVVMPHFLLTKQIRHLNKLLGVRALNHLGNKKGFLTKKSRNKNIKNI